MPPKSSKKAAGAGDSSSRSASTSALNHAAVPDGVSSTSIAATRPSLTSHYASGQAGAGSGSGLYAAVQPSMGGSERVKIWDVNEDRILADIEIPKAKGSIKGLEWTTTAAAGLVSTAEETGAGQKQGQKKRRRGSASHQSTASETQPCLIVAHDSEFAFYTLSSAKAVKTVPVEGGQIQVISKAQVSLGSETTAQILILASASHVHLTSLSDGNFLTSAQLPSNFSKPTALAVVQSSSTASGEKLQIVVASMQICALTIAFNADGTPEVISSQVQPSGVESIRDLAIIPTESESAQANDLVFASLEENSRSVSIWSFPSSNQPSGSPSIVASISSNSIHPLHALSIPTSRPILFLISSEGTAQGFDVSSKSLHPTSDEADASSGKKDKKKRRSLGGKAFGTPQLLISFENPSALGGIVQILPPSSSQADADGMDVDHTSLGGRVILGRAIGVNRIKWEPSDCIDSLGAPISTITLKKPAAEMSSSSDDVRYRDPGTSGSTASALARAEEQALAQDEMELPVEGDMADMTLGERLAVLEPGSSGIGASKSAGKTQEEDDALPGSHSLAPQTAQSLTRMLLQALHTSDPQLLSLILTSSVNSTPVLVRNTVRRLPASMALPLLKACVDRLGKGKAFGRRGGGRGGGLNERQGTCVVAWIRGVLVERGSILMTIPSLPVHLASLSQLLNARLQLQSPLLSLSGRLDMAMAQIESRKEMAEASANLRKPTEYIEGESDSEDDEDALIDEVGIERAIEDGDIEDIGIESRSSRSRADVGSDQEMESGKSRKAKKAVKLALSDDEDEGDNLDEDDDDEEDDEEEDEDEDDFDEDEFDEDEEDEEGSLNGFIDDEAEEASDSESEIEEFN